MCGPTAAGKSDLADSMADLLTDSHGGRWATTLVVDSMQVYRELPIISNAVRASGRLAELTGIVPVSERWTVARHVRAAEAAISDLTDPEVPFVLDAGTGMYLNALLLDLPLAPKVSPETRARAERLVSSAPPGAKKNPRRAARKLELGLAGASLPAAASSIWDSTLRYDARFSYLRPDRDTLDRNILVRSQKIVRDGADEARHLLQLLADDEDVRPNASVRDAIGVKEMLLLASGQITPREAGEAIATRTRRLARRQIRWFDKLISRSLPKSTPVAIANTPGDPAFKHLMHDRMWA